MVPWSACVSFTCLAGELHLFISINCGSALKQNKLLEHDLNSLTIQNQFANLPRFRTRLENSCTRSRSSTQYRRTVWLRVYLIEVCYLLFNLVLMQWRPPFCLNGQSATWTIYQLQPPAHASWCFMQTWVVGASPFSGTKSKDGY